MIMTPWANSDLNFYLYIGFIILRIKQDNMWNIGGLALGSVKKQNICLEPFFSGLSLANSDRC